MHETPTCRGRDGRHYKLYSILFEQIKYIVLYDINLNMTGEQYSNYWQLQIIFNTSHFIFKFLNKLPLVFNIRYLQLVCNFSILFIDGSEIIVWLQYVRIG